MNKKEAIYSSLLLTGDLRGLKYIKDTIKSVPENTFNFCCTIDGTSKAETNMMQMKPLKKKVIPDTFWQDEVI
jgi:hypothetical protein